MIKENKKRITITLSKEQVKWLEKTCKKLHLTQSKYIAWILSRKASELKMLYDLYMNKEDAILSLDEMIEISKVNWIK